MKILSFDVGVKNLALCLLTYDEETNTTTIDDWDIINLCNDDQTTICSTCTNVRKNKICDKPAKFIYKSGHYCGICAKSVQSYVTHGAFDVQKISRLKKDRLVEMASNIGIEIGKKDSKDVIKQQMIEYVQTCAFSIIEKVRVDDLSLVDIGRNLHTKLNVCLETWNTQIDMVLIENQISPIAIRMKTLQGMITQYFIMKTNAEIMYVSSENKLRDYIVEKTSYAQRKKDSIDITRGLITSGKYMVAPKWIELFTSSKKKDDLSDTLLQGLWYIKNKL